MSEIKALSRADYDDVFALSQYAFQYSLSKEELAQKEREADRHDIWGYHIDGQLAGKLHVIPLEVLIQGKSFSMGGVSSVATWPEKRRSGIAKKLLYHALTEMKEQGQVLAYLHPFSVSFYRKYGWELTVNRRHDRIPLQQFKRPWQGEGYVKRGLPEITILNDMYTMYARQFQGMLVRDELWWQQRVLTDEEMHIVVAHNNKDEPEGYLIYKVKNNRFIVKELAYINSNGKYNLYDFISNHDSMAETVEWIVPERDMFPLFIEAPFYEQHVVPYFMTRIVDVPVFLQQYPYINRTNELTLVVEDEFFPENSGAYQVVVVEGKVKSVEKVDHYEEAVHCTVQHLAMMMLGYKRPSELFAAELISGELTAMDKWEKMLPTGQTFLADYF